MKKYLFFSVIVAGILTMSACSSDTSSTVPSDTSTTTTTTTSVLFIDNSPPAELSTDLQTTEDWEFRYDKELDGIIIEECLCADKSTADRVRTQDKDIIVPQTFEGFEGKQVLEIGGGAFRRIVCNSVTLPDGLLYIDKNAFEGTEIAQPLTIPQSVTAISEEAFKSLKCETVILPPIETIPMHLFEFSDIEYISIPETVKTIKGGAFSSCLNLKDISFSEGLEVIEWGAFQYCSLTNKTIHLPSTLKELGDSVFDSYPEYNLTLVYNGTSYSMADYGNFYPLKVAVSENS